MSDVDKLKTRLIAWRNFVFGLGLGRFTDDDNDLRNEIIDHIANVSNQPVMTERERGWIEWAEDLAGRRGAGVSDDVLRDIIDERLDGRGRGKKFGYLLSECERLRSELGDWGKWAFSYVDAGLGDNEARAAIDELMKTPFVDDRDVDSARIISAILALDNMHIIPGLDGWSLSCAEALHKVRKLARQVCPLTQVIEDGDGGRICALGRETRDGRGTGKRK